jgi:transposase-like protein
LAERVLNAEVDDHLDGEAAAGKRNSRNGYSKKTVLTETSKLDQVDVGKERRIASRKRLEPLSDQALSPKIEAVVGAYDEARRRLASPAAHPSPLARRAL